MGVSVVGVGKRPEAAHVDTTDALRVDQAIVRVLRAEQSAREAVTQCAADAEQVRQAARVRAHAIAERAALRVAHAHEWNEARLRAAIEHLDAQRIALQQPVAPDPAEPARVASALDRLAAELTGSVE